MLRSISRVSTRKPSALLATRVSSLQTRNMADKHPQVAAQDAHKAAQDVVQKTNEAAATPESPNPLSSTGPIGSPFTPEGSVGQIGEKIGGPFSKDGIVGSQFDAAKDGIAGQVEKAVGGPAQKGKK